MMYKKTQVEVPEAMVQFVETLTEEERLVRNALMLYHYIANMTISHGRAAEILGVSKSFLIDLYAKIGIPYIDLSKEEIAAELEAYDKVFGEKK